MSINLLSKIPLFAGLPVHELDEIISSLDVIELDDRQILFREGDPGEHFFVVLGGVLEVLMALNRRMEKASVKCWMKNWNT